MARLSNERKMEYYLILSNLPACVTRQTNKENWKPVKDLIHSKIEDLALDRDFGRVDIESGIAFCRINDLEQRYHAYEALQGFSWRNVTLRAWLCEKRGLVMEQTAGPVDHRTGKVMPAPRGLMKMSPVVTRRIGSETFPPSLADPPRPQNSPQYNPQHSPQYSMPSVQFLTAGSATVCPYHQPPQVFPLALYHQQQTMNYPPTLTPSLSHTSRSSSTASTTSCLSDTSGTSRFRGSPSVPGTPFLSQVPSASGFSSTSGTSCQASTTNSTPESPESHRSFRGCNKIQIQNLTGIENVESLRYVLERDLNLYMVRLKSVKGNGRPRVFITFHSGHDAELAVQRLNGQMVFGSRLSVTLDTQPRWSSQLRWSGLPSGRSLGEARQRSSPLKAATVGRLFEKVIVKEIVEKPLRRGPIIIDGSKE